MAGPGCFATAVISPYAAFAVHLAGKMSSVATLAQYAVVLTTYATLAMEAPTKDAPPKKKKAGAAGSAGTAAAAGTAGATAGSSMVSLTDLLAAPAEQSGEWFCRCVLLKGQTVLGRLPWIGVQN